MHSSQGLIFFYFHVTDDNSYDLRFLMIELINDKNRYSHIEVAALCSFA